MQRITIGRYRDMPADVPRPADPALAPARDLYAGWIEGTRDDGSDWVLFLDKNGSPVALWQNRAEDGSVIGDPVVLSA